MPGVLCNVLQSKYTNLILQTGAISRHYPQWSMIGHTNWSVSLLGQSP